MSHVQPVLRINMSGQADNPEAEADRYQAAIDLAEYADRNAFGIVNVEEHHDAEIGWLPSPLLMAGMIASRTQRVTIRASALLATLYDPLRLAEDIAMLDLVSRGRFVFVLGQGYRPSEYHMLDRDWAGRGANTDFLIETLLTAWRGEAFDYRGQRVHVSPKPYTRPHPPFFYGGMSQVAARRAARYGLPFFPGQPMPELESYYLEQCRIHGTEGRVHQFFDMTLLFVDKNPDQAWRELGPCFLRESREYASWSKSDVARHYQSDSDSIDSLRKQGSIEILTPEECLQRARARKDQGSRYEPILHPLAGGIPIQRAQDCVELFVEGVLKRV